MLTYKAYVVDSKYGKLFETDITLRVMEEFTHNDIRLPAIALKSTDA